MTSAPDHPDWLASSLLADVGAYALSVRIKPLDPAWRLWGPALPVSVPPGDNLAIHHALTLAQAGEVLVVDAQAYLERAVMGGIMTTQSKAAGLAGVVIDGAIRDSLELVELGLPVFAAGTHPAGPSKKGDGSVLHPIVCAGPPVRAGDWIHGDCDGVVVVPMERKDELLAAAHAKYLREQERMAAIARGELKPAWLDADLARAAIAVGPR